MTKNYPRPATTWGNFPLRQERSRMKNECAWARHTATSHSPVQRRYGWSWPDGLPLQTYCIQLSAAKMVLPLFVLALNRTLVASWSSVKLNRTLCRTWTSGEKWLCSFKIHRPQPVARGQVGGGKSAILPNGVQRDGKGHQKERVCKKNAR